MHKTTDGDTAYSVLLECYRAMMGEVNKLSRLIKRLSEKSEKG